MGDVTIIGSLLALLSGTCRHCGCHGDSCKTQTGEKCELVYTDGLLSLCTGVACQWAQVKAKRREERAAERKAADAERLARIPFWVRQRKAADRKFRKRQRRREKGSAA